MLNDIIAAYSGVSPTWEKKQTERVQRANAGDFSTVLSKAGRTDTIELSNKGKTDNTVSEIGNEKNSIAEELSNIHADVNKFLEIKNQVRSGTYELNAEEIAKSISNYSVF